MYQQKQKLQNSLLVLVDAVCLVAAFLFGSVVRLEFRPDPVNPTMNGVIANLWLVLVTYFCVYVFFNANQDFSRRDGYEELVYVVKVSAFVAGVIALVFFAAHKLEYLTRTVWAVTVLSNLVLMYTSHMLVKKVAKKRRAMAEKEHMYLVTTQSRVTYILSQLKHEEVLERYTLRIAIVDQDMRGMTIGGYPVVATLEDMMEDPRRDVPRSVFSSGILAIVMYIITACALLILMPQEEIDESSGVIDALIRVFGDYPVLLYALGAAIVFSFLGYALSWALGGNKAAQEAGEFGELPAVFSKTNAAGSPMGAGVLLGIASTVLLVFYGFVASSNEGLFWTLLAFTSIIFFLPYIMMSFVFITLRRKDPDTPRPFRVPGPDWVGRLVALLHGILLIASAIFFFIPPEGEDPLVYILTLGGGVVAALALGEFLVSSSMKKSAAQEN